ncbi:MAG: response regulator transcription factor [Deltaproteobacteria bacterium]|nr:response regulator transcription factor [Deltaproteobacteria bacterium]
MPISRNPIRIMIVDDHEIVREGLRTLLGEVPDLLVVGEAGNGLQALALEPQLEPEVILMDIVMPEMNGIETVRELKARNTKAEVLMLSSFVEEAYVRDSVEAGALGYLLKDASKGDLVRAIRGAREHLPALHPEAQRILIQRVTAPPKESPLDELTPREKAVLELVAKGFSNKQVAGSLHLSEGTVKGYVSAILSKLEVGDRTQAALLAVREGLVQNL